jgi:ferredoxin
MKVRIDQSKCTGHGRCYALAPDVFEADDSGYGTVTRPDVDGAELDEARLAEHNCPEGAISVADA